MAQTNFQDLIKTLSQLYDKKKVCDNSDLHKAITEFNNNLKKLVDTNDALLKKPDENDKIDIMELNYLGFYDMYDNLATKYFKKRISQYYTKNNIIPTKDLLNDIHKCARINWSNVPELLEVICSFGYLPDQMLYDYYKDNTSCTNDTREACLQIIIKYLNKAILEGKDIKIDHHSSIIKELVTSINYTSAGLSDSSGRYILSDAIISEKMNSLNNQLENADNKINKISDTLIQKTDKKEFDILNQRLDIQIAYTNGLEKQIQNLAQKLGAIEDYELVTK